MNEPKSLIHHFVEAVDRYRAERRVAASAQDVQLRQPSRLGRLLRWLTPNGGTLLLVALLILTTNVWAKPLLSPTSAPGPSAYTVNYQGRLADSGGNPITQDDVTLRFAIYDAPTGGSLIWPATGPEVHIVDVVEGLFSVGLGSQTSGGIPTTVWDADRYLEIRVGTETLSPRELIRSVPIAGMALTVPDGSVKSDDLDLDYGTVCLSGHAQVSLPGSFQSVDVPGLSLNFSLERPSQVLIWTDGLARLDDGTCAGEFGIALSVDGVQKTSTWRWTDDEWWMNVRGQRLLSLGSGAHSITMKAVSQCAGTVTVHGVGGHKTCINYLALGEQ